MEFRKDNMSEYCKNCYELLKQLDQLKLGNEHLSEKEEEAKHYLEEAEKFKNCLAQIKKICKFNFTMTTTNLLAKTILQKISECEVEDDR